MERDQTMKAITSANEIRGRQSIPRLSPWLVSLFTISAATGANLLVRAIAFALLPLSDHFPPLEWQSVALLTVAGVALASGVYALVRRLSRNAVRTYTLIAGIALVVSLIPLALIWRDPAAFGPGTTRPEVAVMAMFHGVAALISVVMLTKLAPAAQTPS
jgi:hypothetical protein